MQFKTALAQINPVLGEVKKNREIHLKFIEDAIKEKAELIVFPELSITGYYLRDLAMEVALPSFSNFFEPIFRKSKEIDIVLGFVEKGRDSNIYNSAMYISDGSPKMVYRKIYLPTHGMFEEQRFMARGDRVEAFDTKFGKVALLICRDLFHPSLVLLTFAAGADIVIVPSNMPIRGLDGEKSAIERTVENAVAIYTNFFGNFVIYVNRVGFDDGLGFFGGSFIGTPTGNKLGYAGTFEECLTSSIIDTEEIFKKRQLFPLAREEDLNIVANNFKRIMEEKNG